MIQGSKDDNDKHQVRAIEAVGATGSAHVVTNGKTYVTQSKGRTTYVLCSVHAVLFQGDLKQLERSRIVECAP